MEKSKQKKIDDDRTRKRERGILSERESGGGGMIREREDGRERERVHERERGRLGEPEPEWAGGPC